MKRIICVALCIAISVGATSCSLFGKKDKFSSASKKMISAAEKTCDAREASRKQRKAFNNDMPDPLFEGGAYYTFDTNDLQKLNGGNDMAFDAINETEFLKCEDSSYIQSFIIEFEDEETVEEYLELIDVDSMFDEDKLEEMSEDEETVYAVEVSDDEWAMIAEGEGEIIAIYLKQDENIFITICYIGTDDADLVDEYFDFMREGDYVDMEEMLDNAY